MPQGPVKRNTPSSPRIHRMTIAATWYDKSERGAKEYELHFKAARRGQTRNVRRTLAKRGVPYFQGFIYRRLKKWIPLRRVKVRFEREEPAAKSENTIRVEARTMLFRGKKSRALLLPTRQLPYAKRRRSRVRGKHQRCKHRAA